MPMLKNRRGGPDVLDDGTRCSRAQLWEVLTTWVISSKSILP